MAVEDRELTDQAARIEALLDEIASFPDPAVREKVTEIVQGLLLLYGEGLARVIEIVAEGPGGEDVLAALAADDLVAHLLLLHDLHPVDVETRVLGALEEVRPYLESHGGNVELLGVDEGVARLRLQGSCSGCPSSTVTLKLAIEEAVMKAAPDLQGIDAEGVTEAPRAANFIPLSDLMPKAPAEPAWTSVEGLEEMDGRTTLARDVSGVPVLFLRLDGTFYAYRNACSACGAALEDARLEGSELTCPACTRRYDVRGAGKPVDTSSPPLQPFPLLVKNNVVRVALPPAGVAPS